MRAAASSHVAILADERRAAFRHVGLAVGIVFVCMAALWITGLFDAERLIAGIPALAQLGSEMVPPDFSRWQNWIKPLVDTLAMSSDARRRRAHGAPRRRRGR